MSQQLPLPHLSAEAEVVLEPRRVAMHRASIALQMLAGIVMAGALAATFVPTDPDPLVVIYFAAPSLALAMASNHLDGRNVLTGGSRRRR